MPWAYQDKVRTMEYKTLRYPGHVAIMRPIRELGLLDLTPVRVNGKDVVPRDAFITTVSPKLTKPDGRDLVALRDRKSTRLNSSHTGISYAVFCLKKKIARSLT